MARSDSAVVSCESGDKGHAKFITEFPLPQPPQDPITLLTGHGRIEITGSCPYSSDFDRKYVRTGD